MKMTLTDASAKATAMPVDIIKFYTDQFNRDDEEFIKNDIDNAHVYEWMKKEVPVFECPDKDIERAYYFRFWTYRKHIKTTKDGVVITEFLPKVLWSGKHNTINAAVGHHIYEGRWLKNSEKYLKSYIEFFLTVSNKNHMYSTWLIDAAYKYATITGDFDFGKDFIDKLDKYYKEWERTHKLSDGSFWSYDNYDAMEYSVSGTDTRLKALKGIRPTLNSYMCADAFAISQFAKVYGDKKREEEYIEKYRFLKKFINEKLYEDGFFRAYHYKKDSEAINATDKKGASPRELIGYIPFMFNIPHKGREECFKLLTSTDGFFSEYGLTTVEKTNERFLYSARHECLWNGYIWPFATAQTLTALKNVALSSDEAIYKDMFVTLFSQYARMHKRETVDGKVISWIDEVMDPGNGDWSSRTLLKKWGWFIGKGGYERGKDYNHSTFCDLVISGLVGVCVQNGKLSVTPLAPDNWEYFRLSGVKLLGKEYDIIYDKSGKKYGRQQGLSVVEI